MQIILKSVDIVNYLFSAAALKSRGPNQGVVRTLYQSQASSSNQGYQANRAQPPAYNTPHWSHGKVKESPMKWTVRDSDGILSPIRYGILPISLLKSFQCSNPFYSVTI